ncbi:hypothetical protein C8J56DRAFT_1161064 [Mycena floridula]|nr:hypothetical protein C8J56DRAFT_1161064 [Mycena floridula]
MLRRSATNQARRFQSTFTTRDSVVIPQLNNAKFPFLWLRDACQSPASVDPSTSQKLFRLSDIPLDIRPQSVRFDNEELSIQWVDGHASTFTLSFLQHHSVQPKSNPTAALFNQHLDSVLWDRNVISKSPELFIEYGSISTPSGLLKALDHLCRFGLLFIRDVPTTETSDSHCELVKLAKRLGEIRTTFYGKVWDVRSVPDSKNIAYTNLDLGLHMDLLYFQHPPQFQILHCLLNKVIGGESIFLDAFNAAHQLNEQDFEVLSSHPVRFHYVNDGHSLHYEHPTIELWGPQSTERPGERSIKYINYSPPFQAPLPLSTDRNFYESLGRFEKLLDKPENSYRYTLEEGVAVVFDNRRVLHARTAFQDIEGQSQSGIPNRWLKGCYLEGDPLWDRARVLRANS